MLKNVSVDKIKINKIENSDKNFNSNKSNVLSKVKESSGSPKGASIVLVQMNQNGDIHNLKIQPVVPVTFKKFYFLTDAEISAILKKVYNIIIFVK